MTDPTPEQHAGKRCDLAGAFALLRARGIAHASDFTIENWEAIVGAIGAILFERDEALAGLARKDAKIARLKEKLEIAENMLLEEGEHDGD